MVCDVSRTLKSLGNLIRKKACSGSTRDWGWEDQLACLAFLKGDSNAVKIEKSTANLWLLSHRTVLLGEPSLPKWQAFTGKIYASTKSKRNFTNEGHV